MGRQQNRLQILIGALPVEYQRIRIHFRNCQVRVPAASSQHKPATALREGRELRRRDTVRTLKGSATPSTYAAQRRLSNARGPHLASSRHRMSPSYRDPIQFNDNPSESVLFSLSRRLGQNLKGIRTEHEQLHQATHKHAV